MTKEEMMIEACKAESSADPIEIFNNVVEKCGVSIHGPEHHVLDGACVLTAFYNAGGSVDLDAALETLLQRGLKMPGAACGHWGVCGLVGNREYRSADRGRFVGLAHAIHLRRSGKTGGSRRPQMLQKERVPGHKGGHTVHQGTLRHRADRPGDLVRLLSAQSAVHRRKVPVP